MHSSYWNLTAFERKKQFLLCTSSFPAHLRTLRTGSERRKKFHLQCLYPSTATSARKFVASGMDGNVARRRRNAETGRLVLLSPKIRAQLSFMIKKC